MKKLALFFMQVLTLTVGFLGVLALLHMVMFCIPLALWFESMGIYNYGLAILITGLMYCMAGWLFEPMANICEEIYARLPIKPQPHPFLKNSLKLAERNAWNYLKDWRIIVVVPTVFIAVVVELFFNLNALYVELGAGKVVQTVLFLFLIYFVYTVLALCYELLSGPVSRKFAKTAGFMIPAIKETLADMKCDMRHEKENVVKKEEWAEWMFGRKIETMKSFKDRFLVSYSRQYIFLKRHAYNKFNVRLV